MQHQDQKFVERFEMAIMQYVILSKARQGEVTRENLQQTFRGNLQMSGDHFERCVETLVEDGHLEEVDGKYRATDDGREDVQKLETLVMELPQVIGSTGGQAQRPGMAKTTTGAGGATGTSTMGGGTTGQTMGNQGNVGTQSRQGGAGNVRDEMNREKGDVPKGGATSAGKR